MSLLVIAPSRGRPQRAREMLDTFYDTRAAEDTDIVFVLHRSDPSFDAYAALDADCIDYEDATTLTAKLNRAAADYTPLYDYIQFAADDMRYRTPGWDVAMTNGLASLGAAFAYANSATPVDLANHVMADSAVIRALGWFALPASQHLYLDNAWTVLGKASGSLLYFPDVVIEHLHPAFGTAEKDASYTDTNSRLRYSEDRVAFERWMREDLEADAATVRKTLVREAVS